MKPTSYHRRPNEGWLVSYTHKVPEQSLQRSYRPNTICMQQFAFSKTHIHVNVTGLNFTGFVEIWGGSKVSSSFIII